MGGGTACGWFMVEVHQAGGGILVLAYKISGLWTNSLTCLHQAEPVAYGHCSAELRREVLGVWLQAGHN